MSRPPHRGPGPSAAHPTGRPTFSRTVRAAPAIHPAAAWTTALQLAPAAHGTRAHSSVAALPAAAHGTPMGVFFMEVREGHKKWHTWGAEWGWVWARPARGGAGRGGAGSTHTGGKAQTRCVRSPHAPPPLASRDRGPAPALLRR